jgi:hypothetical protein
MFTAIGAVMSYKRQRSPQPPFKRGAVKVPLLKGDLGGSALYLDRIARVLYESL